LIEQTLGFGRMSGGEGLGKEVIETLAKVWNSVPCEVVVYGEGSLEVLLRY
jgi:hypothetical protein